MLPRALIILTGLLVLKVTFYVVLGYRDYFPPDFESDFLRGRQSYFSGAYQWAFYAHIATGPICLLLGLLLVSEQFRIRFRALHRAIGKAQVALVLLLLCPSGLWMAYYAETGAVAAIGFATLAIATGACALSGWQTAVSRRFAEHRRWMWRCFALLCSAVVLRLMGGLATVLNLEASWSYPLSAWASWLVPLTALELSLALNRTYRRVASSNTYQSHSTSAALSFPAIEMSARR